MNLWFCGILYSKNIKWYEKHKANKQNPMAENWADYYLFI